MKKLLGKVGLSLKFSLAVFMILSLTMLISGGLMSVVIHIGLVPKNIIENTRMIPIVTLIASIIIGTIISILFSKSMIRNVEQFVKASNQLASGDFTAKLNMKAPLEFKIISDNFNHMAKELGSIEVLRADFINNFSHEFKTPIVSIKGFAEILKYDDLTPEERKEYLDIVIEESSRLAALATNVLELAKIEQQEILTNKQSFNLSEQIRQCILLLDAKISEKNIDLELDIEDYTVEGNKEMLQQVWINLLDNAIKFSREKGTIHIRIQKCDHKIKVEISDTGCGISEEELPRIFDKFYQADISHATRGNGLGLSLVKKIITLHGGTISCKSKLTEGTTFVVEVPVVEKI